MPAFADGLTGSQGDYDACPDWKFGDVVGYTKDLGVQAMVLGWQHRVDYNWPESVFVGIVIAVPPGEKATHVGDVIAPYCGWYRPIDV